MLHSGIILSLMIINITNENMYNIILLACNLFICMKTSSLSFILHYNCIPAKTMKLHNLEYYVILYYLKGVSHYKYFRQLVGNILTLKRFFIKLIKILVGNPLTFRKLS